MSNISAKPLNQHCSRANGLLQIFGAHAGPPGRFSLDDLKLSVAEFPVSYGHQHNAGRGNTFAALTLCTPADGQRLSCVAWAGDSGILGRNDAKRVVRSEPKADKPVGFELSFGQALAGSDHALSQNIEIDTLEQLTAHVLGAQVNSELVEFSFEVQAGSAQSTVPDKQTHVGRKAPFEQLVDKT